MLALKMPTHNKRKLSEFVGAMPGVNDKNEKFFYPTFIHLFRQNAALNTQLKPTNSLFFSYYMKRNRILSVIMIK
jgi:hypothetical protein